MNSTTSLSDEWFLSPPNWLPDCAITPTGTKPLVSVSEYPDGIARLVPAELPRDPLAALPQSPVSRSPSPTKPEVSTSVSIRRSTTFSAPRVIPTCMDGDICSLSRPRILRAPLDYLATAPLPRAAALLGGSAAHASSAWIAQRSFAPARDALTALLHDGGIRLERRKRLSSGVAPDFKREVRAQRNRERSHALRRHHKRRLALLDEASAALQVHNRALRVLAKTIIKLFGRPQLLQKALSSIRGDEVGKFMDADDDVEHLDMNI